MSRGGAYSGGCQQEPSANATKMMGFYSVSYRASTLPPFSYEFAVSGRLNSRFARWSWGGDFYPTRWHDSHGGGGQCHPVEMRRRLLVQHRCGAGKKVYSSCPGFSNLKIRGSASSTLYTLCSSSGLVFL